jgi:hypothetical protein
VPLEHAASLRRHSSFILDRTPFNCFFNDFLLYTFSFTLGDILPAVQYCSIFVILPISLDMPVLLREGEPMSFEEYCGLQTCNGNIRPALQKLARGLWD